MELGEKLRQARLEAGLSQRALCGEEITRNMLSQIEHGTASPSMGTLKMLAARLGKPVSFFLDEDVMASPNRGLMESARRFYDGGEYAETAETLRQYRGPDEIFDREQALLLALARLGWAEQLLESGRDPYAREILEGTATAGVYGAEALERRRLLLLSRLEPTQLPSLDGELLIRAENALNAGDAVRAAHLLEAADDHSSANWNFLRGRAGLAARDYALAAQCFRAAEQAFPEKTVPLLEQCYRELGDYKQAYEYACKRRGGPSAQPIRFG